MNQESLELLPSRISTREIRSEWGKRKAPMPYSHIVRFLMKHKGENVDSVFSEYTKCDWIPVEHRNMKGFSHFVEIHTFLRDGEVFYNSDFWFLERAVSDENSKNFFYVHPTTKKLIHKPRTNVVRNPWALKKKQELAKTFRFISNGVQLLKLSGIWYEINFSVNTKKVFYNYSTENYMVRDLTEKEIEKLSKSPLDYTSRHCYKNIQKRQLSSKELKAYSLKNN